MELSEIVSALRARWYYVGLVVAAAVAVGLIVKQSVRTTSTGTATVQLLVDSPRSALADLRQDPTPLVTRTAELAQVMTSSAVLDSIAAEARVQSGQVSADGPYSGQGMGLNVIETPSAARGIQLVTASAPYRLQFIPQTGIPIITAFVQGPDENSAAHMATAVFPGVQSWLKTLQNGKVSSAVRVTVRQLGGVQAGTANSGSSKIVAGVSAAGVLILGLLTLIAVEVRTGTARSARRRHRHRRGHRHRHGRQRTTVKRVPTPAHSDHSNSRAQVNGREHANGAAHVNGGGQENGRASDVAERVAALVGSASPPPASAPTESVATESTSAAAPSEPSGATGPSPSSAPVDPVASAAAVAPVAAEPDPAPSATGTWDSLTRRPRLRWARTRQRG